MIARERRPYMVRFDRRLDCSIGPLFCILAHPHHAAYRTCHILARARGIACRWLDHRCCRRNARYCAFRRGTRRLSRGIVRRALRCRLGLWGLRELKEDQAKSVQTHEHVKFGV
jgi:hypothetical protein